MNKERFINIAILLGLAILTAAIFKLSVGWFTIVMSVFATAVFVLIITSPDEKEK